MHLEGDPGSPVSWSHCWVIWDLQICSVEGSPVTSSGSFSRGQVRLPRIESSRLVPGDMCLPQLLWDPSVGQGQRDLIMGVDFHSVLPLQAHICHCTTLASTQASPLVRLVPEHPSFNFSRKKVSHLLPWWGRHGLTLSGYQEGSVCLIERPQHYFQSLSLAQGPQCGLASFLGFAIWEF